MGSPVIPPPPDYTGVPAPPDAGAAPPNPYAGPIPQGTDDPGKLGRILGYANKNPALSDATKIGLVVPGAASLLGRMGMQMGAQGAGALARGEGLGAAAKDAAIGGAGQLVGEGIGGVARLAANSGALGQSIKNASAKNAFNKSMTDTLNATEQQGFQQATQAHQEQAAKAVMEHYQKQVPALKGFTPDTKGLLDAIYGKGPEAVSKEFDAAMKAAADKAKGILIEIPIDAANALKLRGQGAGMFPMPSAGKAQVSGARAGTPLARPNFDTVKVDAADAINAMLGKSTKEPSAYRAVASALDDANLGDEAARSAYKSFRSLADFVDKTKGLKGEQVNPGKMLGGFTDRKSIDLLRRRGEGDIFSGPFQAMRGAPTAPTPRPMPPTVEGQPAGLFKTMPNPLAHHPWVAGAAGGAAAHGLGLGWPGHVAGFTGAAALSNAMPRQIVTKAPLPPEVEQRLINLPSLLSALGLRVAST